MQYVPRVLHFSAFHYTCIEDKWKNHFSEMKRDIGMSLHEKEGEQEDAYTETGSH